jgi:transcriptional regulator GlxA family with amidase domain
MRRDSDVVKILVAIAPNFNMAATMAFIDPFRAANYLEGKTQFRWTISAERETCLASNGSSLATRLLDDVAGEAFDIVVVSCSWTPEAVATPHLLASLRKWARRGSVMGSIDTGAFVLAEAGLLTGRRATVHYEHIDAFKELYPSIEVTETLYVMDDKCFTCCGGLAAADVALRLIGQLRGDALANAAARYIFHPQLRTPDSPQNPANTEPLGNTVPQNLRRAIALMEQHLENVISIVEMCEQIGLSQRQIDRLFRQHVGKSPVLYYRDIRLDRARGLLTQTAMLVSEVALASGFASAVHFSRAYKQRFGFSPREDRVEGRIPFEFRAWPMHHPVPRQKTKSKPRKAKKG